jgi:hypothetical protein
MTNTQELKRSLMLKFASDPELFSLIGNSNASVEYPDDLIFENIFPFLKVDYTETQAGNYIGIGINYPVVKKKSMFKNAQIRILIICNNETLRIGKSSYTRTDKMGQRIIDLLNGDNSLGFPLELYSDNEGIHSSRFYYRELVFQNTAVNIPMNCE